MIVLNITCLNHLGTFQLHLEEKPSNSNPFPVVLSPPRIQTLGHTTTCGVPGRLTLGAPTPHPRVVVAKDERLRPRAYCHCGLWSCLNSNKKSMWCYSIGNHSDLRSLFRPSVAVTCHGGIEIQIDPRLVERWDNQHLTIMDQSMEMVVKHPRIPSSVYPVAVWGFNLPAIDLYVFMYIYIYHT